MARNTEPKKRRGSQGGSRGSKVSAALDPTGEHGTNAVEDVARKMHIDPESESTLWDPTGDHDPEALKDVARKMGVRR